LNFSYLQNYTINIFKKLSFVLKLNLHLFTKLIAMTQLRPYQKQFLERIRKSLFENERIIACMATGGGKTKVFLSIAKMATDKNKKVLILSESTKIYLQIKTEIGACQHIAEGIKNEHIDPSANVYVAMAQTLMRREFIDELAKLGKDLIIINDEAHIGTSTKVLQKLLSSYIMGFTATPHYQFAKHLPLLYNDIVVGAQPQELVEMGFLSPYKHYARVVVDLKGLKKGANGDFTEESQNQAFEKPEVYDELLTDLNSFPFKKCIVFCSSIHHATQTSDELKSKGFTVSTVHSKNENADYELFQFVNGENEICVSVGVLTKGFDFPAIDLVILYRATSSVPLYLQMIGRGSRLFPNKEYFTVIDYGGNASRHGLWSEDRDWETLWKKEKKKREGVAPIKMCPKCFYINSPRAKVCAGCGHVLQKSKEEEEKEAKETKLVEVTERYNQIRGRKIDSLNPQELSIYVKFTNKKMFAMRVAKAKGETFLTEYANIMGYKKGFTYFQKADETINFANITIR
jgi:superfamily II DNA or RNA helicase